MEIILENKWEDVHAVMWGGGAGGWGADFAVKNNKW